VSRGGAKQKATKKPPLPKHERLLRAMRGVAEENDRVVVRCDGCGGVQVSTHREDLGQDPFDDDYAADEAYWSGWVAAPCIRGCASLFGVSSGYRESAA
jgi:hypothetical protein